MADDRDYYRRTFSLKRACDQDLIDLIERTDNVSRLVRDALRAWADQEPVHALVQQVGEELRDIRRALVGQYPRERPAEPEEAVEALDSILSRIRG